MAKNDGNIKRGKYLGPILPSQIIYSQKDLNKTIPSIRLIEAATSTNITAYRTSNELCYIYNKYYQCHHKYSKLLTKVTSSRLSPNGRTTLTKSQ